MNAEHDPLVATVDTFLSGLDEPLNVVRELTAKTDIDFIDDSGNFNPKLKDENGIAIGEAIKTYNLAVKDRRIASMALQAGLDPVTAVSLAYEAGQSVALKDWRYAGSGSRAAEPVPPLPYLRGDVKSKLFDTVVKIYEATTWWSDEAPYFLKYESETIDNVSAVTAFPSRGAANVVAEVNDSTDSWSSGTGSIYSKFEGGTRVVITGSGEQVKWIEVRDKPENFTWPILGYHDFPAKPKDFMDKSYIRFKFVDEHPRDPYERTNSQRFAARIALGMLIANTGGNQPDVQLPAPNDEFSQSIVDLLAVSTVAAFLPPKMRSSVRHGGGSMTGYEVEGVTTHEAKNLIKSSTEQELRMYLQAIGARVLDLFEATETLLARRYESKQLGGRIDVIKARSNIETFFCTLA